MGPSLCQSRRLVELQNIETLPITFERQSQYLSDVASLQPICDKEMGRAFQLGELMWKVTVISYSSTSDRVDIVFSHSHAIGDGNSVPRALNDWMVNYDKLSTLDESTLLSNIQSLPPLSSPLQLYFPDGIGYANKIKAWIVSLSTILCSPTHCSYREQKCC